MKKTLTIPTISCGHCLMSIRRELGFVNGVDFLDGNVDSRTVLVEYSQEEDLDRARKMLADVGYSPTN